MMDISFSSAASLGTPSSHEYRAGWGVWVYGLFGIVLVLAGLAGISHLIFGGTFTVTQLVVSLGAILIAIFFAFLWYRGFSTRVQVYEHGFAYTRGNKTHNFRWDEIEAIWQHVVTYRLRLLIFYVPVSTGYKYTIRKTTGETIKLTNSIGKVAELGPLIQEQVLKHMMPRAIETYNNGGTLQFGKLSISKMGINNGKETLPWDQVKGVQIDSGYIIVKKTGKWMRWVGADVAKIPNLFLFISLVDRIVGINR
jgi:hypothetical protein